MYVILSESNKESKGVNISTAFSKYKDILFFKK